jgi:hypothetical protein
VNGFAGNKKSIHTKKKKKKKKKQRSVAGDPWDES